MPGMELINCRVYGWNLDPDGAYWQQGSAVAEAGDGVKTSWCAAAITRSCDAACASLSGR